MGAGCVCVCAVLALFFGSYVSRQDPDPDARLLRLKKEKELSFR